MFAKRFTALCLLGTWCVEKITPILTAFDLLKIRLSGLRYAPRDNFDDIDDLFSLCNWIKNNNNKLFIVPTRLYFVIYKQDYLRMVFVA